MRIFVFLYWGEEKGWWLALRSTFFGPVYLSVLDPTLIPKRKCIIRRFFLATNLVKKNTERGRTSPIAVSSLNN